ncbi:hypothetical protein J437_LFUL000078 [Ladona fulva]|uniref:E3 ubiquitin-protein ligase listerin n=1 Tax=Ladona fulva TaxID=123851 RepID=A0A8K0P0E9_LADFU|nr:hypothetical protein J437_LFUL000078 [Ladona fulva]
MGGKHKQAQRTKNNARPSSSGRSAELLRNSSLVVDFASAKDGSSRILPGFSLSQSEDTESPNNAEFVLLMKKMYKKDSTTKLKALQEFVDLCKRSDSSDVKSVLPQWPHIYSLLAGDIDHRVREASHQAHRQLAVLAKKNIAPYLKVIVGPWFIGQYDTYAPAASAARSAFQEVFPPSKFIEAIIFCQEEIFNYIFDNLINQNVLSNSKNFTPEEMEAKLIRLLVSSLQSYAFYLQQLPITVLKDSEQMNKKLISSGKFWKYSCDKSPLVRSSWYLVLIALCQNAPFLLDEASSQVAHAVFNNLDETDPITLPLVWEAALHALVTIKDIWSQINPQKVVLPKLWRVLQDGGQGNAATIFPNLLPLLSKIPSQILDDREVFYRKFFDSMRNGFKQKSVQLSQSESVAVSVSFIECLRYVVMIHKEEPNFCKTLLFDQLIPVLKTSFTDKRWALSTKALYSQTASLIYSWSKKTSESSCYKDLVLSFWSEISNLIASQIHETEIDFALLSKNHLEFVVCLKNPNRPLKKESLKVTFLEPEQKLDEAGSCSSEVKCWDEEELGHILNLVLHVLDDYTDEIHFSKSPSHVEALVDLILQFNSQELVLKLAENRNEESEDSFTVDNLLMWLQDPAMPISKIIRVLFLLLVQLPAEEKQNILSLLYELNNVVLQWCIVNAISSHYDDPSIKAWLKSSRLADILIRIIKDALNQTLDGHVGTENNFQVTWDLFKRCFSRMSDGDFPVATETLTGILKILSSALQVPPTGADPNLSARFVADLTRALFESDPLVLLLTDTNQGSEHQPAGSVLCKLAVSMFTTCCTGQLQSVALSSSTLALLGSSWQLLISSIAQAFQIQKDINPFLEVVKRFACSVCEMLNGTPWTEGIAMQTVTFMKVSAAHLTDPQQRDSILALLCNTFFLSVMESLESKKWTKDTILDMCLAAEILRNSICTYSEVCVHEGDPEEFLALVTASIYIVTVLTKLQVEESEDDSSNIKFSGSSAQLTDKYSSNIVEALETFTLCKLILLHFKNDVLSTKINPKCKVLKSGIKSLITSMSSADIEQLKNFIISRIGEDKELGFWIIKYLLSDILSDKNVLNIFQNLRSDPHLESLLHFHLIQIFSTLLPGEILQEISSDIVEKLEQPTEGDNQAYDERAWPQGCLSVNLTCLSHKDVCMVIETADFLEACVKGAWMKMLSPQNWDMVLCSVVKWVQHIASVVEDLIWWRSVDHAGLISSIFCLLASIIESIEGDQRESVSHLSDDFISEWRNVYAPEIYHPVIRVFLVMTENKISSSLVWGHIEKLLFEDVVRPVRTIPTGYVKDSPFPFLSDYSGDRKASYLVNKLSAYLQSTEVPLQTGAYHLILKLLPNILAEDMKTVLSDGSDMEKVYEKLSCSHFQEKLSEVQSVVDTMLMDFRDSGHLSSLLFNLFRLLPEHLLHGCSVQINPTSSKKVSSLFEYKLAAEEYDGTVLKFCLL